MSTKKIKTKIAARSDADKAEVRKLIFAEARRLILEEGFASLSIRKLAEKIGYAPGTIYLYFKSRDELVREICAEGFGKLFEVIKAAAKNEFEPNKRLAALMHAYAEFALANPETYRLSFMEKAIFAEEMFRIAPLEATGGAGRQAFGLIVKTIRELKRENQLDSAEDENLLAETLWAAVHGIVSLKLVSPAFPVNSVETLIDKAMTTFQRREK